MLSSKKIKELYCGTFAEYHNKEVYAMLLGSAFREVMGVLYYGQELQHELRRVVKSDEDSLAAHLKHLKSLYADALPRMQAGRTKTLLQNIMQYLINHPYGADFRIEMGAVMLGEAYSISWLCNNKLPAE